MDDFKSHAPAAVAANLAGRPRGQDRAGDRGPALSPDPHSPDPQESGGPSGPEPTRYGDWERKGICVDF